MLQIDSCYLCKHINGYKSHCIHKTIKFKEIHVDIFSSIPDWCPLPDASQSVQSVVDIKNFNRYSGLCLVIYQKQLTVLHVELFAANELINKTKNKERIYLWEQ